MKAVESLFHNFGSQKHLQKPIQIHSDAMPLISLYETVTNIVAYVPIEVNDVDEQENLFFSLHRSKNSFNARRLPLQNM